jgi:hypothetical protein
MIENIQTNYVWFPSIIRLHFYGSQRSLGTFINRIPRIKEMLNIPALFLTTFPKTSFKPCSFRWTLFEGYEKLAKF